jgi:hypothetical protein
MMQALADLLDASRGLLFLGFVVFLRVGGAMAVLPAFGEQIVPVRVRLGLAIAFTAIVAAPVAAQLQALQLDRLPPLWLASEIAVGLLIGLMLRLFVIALQVAGTIAAQATSLSQLFGGTSDRGEPWAACATGAAPDWFLSGAAAQSVPGCRTGAQLGAVRGKPDVCPGVFDCGAVRCGGADL